VRSATTTTTFVPFALLLVAEAVALFLGQRRLFWLAVDATGSRLLGYLLAMPGTVLHESAHYLACVLLRVPVGRQVRMRDGRRVRVRLFYPRRDRYSGSVTLGSVPHAATDPLCGALIAAAPLVLVPPLLVAIALAFARTSDPSQLRHLLPGLATWKLGKDYRTARSVSLGETGRTARRAIALHQERAQLSPSVRASALIPRWRWCVGWASGIAPDGQ
jgi:hypothetical protein